MRVENEENAEAQGGSEFSQVTLREAKGVDIPGPLKRLCSQKICLLRRGGQRGGTISAELNGCPRSQGGWGWGSGHHFTMCE
jgi:hypothetical protein